MNKKVAGNSKNFSLLENKLRTMIRNLLREGPYDVNSYHSNFNKIQQDGNSYTIPIYDQDEKDFPPIFQKLGPAVLAKVCGMLKKLHHNREAAEDNYRDIPNSYYNGVNALEQYIVKQFKKVGITCQAEEGDDTEIVLTVRD